jgi:hypothetical protein
MTPTYEDAWDHFAAGARVGGMTRPMLLSAHDGIATLRLPADRTASVSMWAAWLGLPAPALFEPLVGHRLFTTTGSRVRDLPGWTVTVSCEIHDAEIAAALLGQELTGARA